MVNLLQSLSWRSVATGKHLKQTQNYLLPAASTTHGEKIPRRFGSALFGAKLNDLLQFYYLELGKSTTTNRYMLMIRDDHSGCTWLYPTPSKNAEEATHAIIDWCAAFGPPRTFMSDRPTHFRNEVSCLLAREIKCNHHFTQAYSLWINGTIERLGKEILQVCRALVSELQLRVVSWPDLIPIVQSVINHFPSPQRNNIATVTAFTGL